MYQICAMRIHLTRRSQGTKSPGWAKDYYTLIYKEFTLRRDPDEIYREFSLRSEPDDEL
jgi:hypothetical protein